MNDLLLNVVRRQRNEINKLLPDNAVFRERTSGLRNSLLSPLIKVIVGPRRAGKSTLALQALEDHSFAYLNFEDESLPPIDDGDHIIQALELVYDKVDFYFFDEIQNFPRWQSFLNRLQRQGTNLVVTGSNARLLSDELSTALTGRHAEIEVLPFSFREARSGAGEDFNLDRFLVCGGFPEVVLGKTDYKPYLSTLWDAVILKDIAKRTRVRDVNGLSNVLSLLLSGTTARFNSESLRRALARQLSAPTVKKFVSFGVETYLISDLTVYNPKPRTRIKSDRKAYTTDNGFFSAKSVRLSKNYGVLLENAVFNELRIRGFKPNHSLFYYITRSGFELDFLLRDGHENVEGMQVCYSLGSLKTKERELRALAQAAEELKLRRLTVVTMEQEKTETWGARKIDVVPAHKWFSGSVRREKLGMQR